MTWWALKFKQKEIVIYSAQFFTNSSIKTAHFLLPVVVGDGNGGAAGDELRGDNLAHEVVLVGEGEAELGDVALRPPLHPRQVLVKLKVQRRQLVYGTGEKSIDYK